MRRASELSNVALRDRRHLSPPVSPMPSFDVVHAHQVLQHLTDPWLRWPSCAGCSGRAASWPPATVTTAPSPGPPTTRARPLDGALPGVTARNGHHARIGPSLLGLAHAAGFDNVTVEQQHLDVRRPRVPGVVGRPVGRPGPLLPRLAEQAVDYGLSTPEELDDIAQAFLQWAAAPDGVFVAPHVEILARR